MCFEKKDNREVKIDVYGRPVTANTKLQVGFSEISSNKRKDKDVRLSIAIMNMAESKPRPLPKPRVRHKSAPAHAIESQGVSPKIPPNSAPAMKPPITKPKPGYKPVVFDNKTLVSIETDIDIESGSTANVGNNGSKGINDLEKNNNVANLKHGNNLNGNGRKAGSKINDVISSGVGYSKPLPPVPMKIPALVPDEDSSTTENNLKSSTENPVIFDMSKLPIKPPRLNTSSSNSQLISSVATSDTVGKKLMSAQFNDDFTNRKRNPPLPRKPTCLRKSTGPEEVETSTFYIDSEMETVDGESKEKLVANQIAASHGLSSREKGVINTHSSDSQLGKLSKTSSCLKPNSKDNFSNIGCTPPLPRKPVRKLAPTGNQVTNALKNNDSQNRVSSDSSGDKYSGRSPPNQKEVAITSFEIRTDINCDEEKVSSLSNQTGSNTKKSEEESRRLPSKKGKDIDKEQMTSSKEDDKQASMRRSGLNQRRPPPKRPPPPSAHQSPAHQSPARRPPPGLPKRPSLEGNRKSNPPPLPNAPRPFSIARGNAAKLKHFRRSQSEGDIFNGDEDEDAVYCEAYEHLHDSMYSVASSKDRADDGEYEFPDKDIVKEFMEARQQKSLGSMKKGNDVINEVKQRNKTRLESTTYSSSSDDSEHEYVEPISPMPEKRMSKAVPSPTNTVSSSGSSHYVEAIHVPELTKTEESKLTTESHEFKPFNDMDSEWSETKIIDWEYKGESDDSSDGSYVEPDSGDDLDDFEEEDDEAFTDEPLYQIYQAVALEKERTLSLRRSKKGGTTGTRGRTFTMGYGTMRGGKMLWSQLPEVRNAGLLENVSAEQRKFQEAIFEVISSEASYLKSLNLLVDHFLNSQEFSTESDDSILDKYQVSEIFSNILEIVNVSERFLDELRARQRQSVLIETISDIITNHATNQFQAYVSYCSSQYKQDRALTNLKKTNWRFSEALEKLERDSRVFGLTLQSFLVLPMQRVTRYPLLVDAIVRRCEPGHKEYYRTDNALKAVNQIVHKCNEGARKEERIEEMMQIDKIISFMKISPIKLVTDDRWLLRRGPIQLLEVESKSTLSNTLRGKFRKYRVKPIYLFLFSDLLVVTKKKSENMYSVIDYAKRNMIRIQESTSKATNAFLLVFLENFENKTKELSVRADNETDLTRWREAFEPPSASNDDEKIYGSWDCPQVQALHDYQAQQSDELSLVPGDVVNVLRKLPDGWYEGERIRDGVCGWFPANHTEEIRNEHVRARNLHQRYRLLAASTAFLDTKKR